MSATSGRRHATFGQLAAVICAAIQPGPVVRIAVDGVDGAGKTELADGFAAVLHQHPGSR